jgi:hypothetical protein
MPGVRSTKLETEKRVFTIQGWIISGVPEYLILKNIEQQFQNVDGNHLSRRQAKVLVKKAYKIWHEEEAASVDEKRSLRIAELKQDVRSMSSEFKNTPKGMSVLLHYKKEISKLEALYPDRQLVLKGDKDNPIAVSDDFSEEKEKRLNALLEKAGKILK